MGEIFKISSVVIAKNEENNIENCIRSQLDCVDEVVVIVDSSSNDRTYEIANSFPDVICRQAEWQGYSRTKQNGLEYTSNNWVLWIDADETVTTELADELNKLKESEPAYSAFSVPRKAFFIGKWIRHSGWFPGRVVRLFDKRKVQFSDNSVHEHLMVQGNTGDLKAPLNHFTDPNIDHYYDKFNHYTSLAANELFRKKKKARVIDLILRPTLMFFKMYIIKLGFLDGKHGFILAVFSANYVFTKYAKLWERYLQERNNGVLK